MKTVKTMIAEVLESNGCMFVYYFDKKKKREVQIIVGTSTDILNQINASLVSDKL